MTVEESSLAYFEVLPKDLVVLRGEGGAKETQQNLSKSGYDVLVFMI
jgi:hypothetical protein